MYIVASKVVVIPRVVTHHIVVVYINSDVYYYDTIGM